MICSAAAKLRREWYAVTPQLINPPYLDDRSNWTISEQQDDRKYQRALWRLRNHIQECEVCRNTDAQV